MTGWLDAYARVALMCLILAGGCGESKDTSIKYQLTAKQNYEKGLKELKDENFNEAMKYFTFVKTRFPYSRYATLAELRIADTQLARGRYAEAIDAYRQFMKFHPTHEMTENGYAQFKICEAYLKQIPDEWFLSPPAYEKDQTPTREALREYDAFFAKYPNSKYAKDAKKQRELALRHIVDHELYVARFYLSKRKPKGAVLRLQGILKEFPGVGNAPDILMLLGHTYLQMEELEKAREIFTRIIVEYPNEYHAKRAKLYLDYMKRRYGKASL